MSASLRCGRAALGGRFDLSRQEGPRLRRFVRELPWRVRWWVLYGLPDRALDRDLHMPTGRVLDHAGTVVGDNLAFGETHEPTPVVVADQVFRSLPRWARGLTFVDYGSGPGRMLLLAARRAAFSRIVGVEYSVELHEAAVQNISRRGLGERVSSVNCDAAEFPIPPGPCVFYFFHPFGREVLEQVLAKIKESHRARPREMYVVYYHPVHDDVFSGSALFQALPTRRSFRLLRRLMRLRDLRVYQSKWRALE